MSVVDIAGRSVEFVRRGAGSAVMLSSPTWWPLDAWNLSGIAELSAAHDVVAFNHRGIGSSAATGAPYTVETMADDLVALADALNLDRVHVVGYAIGAAVALAAARRHPGRIRSLTLAAPSRGLPSSAQSPAGAAAREIDDAGFEAHIRGHVTSAHPSFERERPADAAALGDALWRHQGSLANFLEHADARRGYEALDIAAGLAVPALVLVGAEDAAARGALSAVDAARAIATALSDARLEITAGVGHMPLWEAPELWALVLAFLQEVEA
jgi:3-oxoadipate enol-lactonase